MSSTLHPSRRAFTLIELLVVISIIAILMGLLFPVFGVIRAKAWASRTRDTALQAANAWHFFFQEKREFPKTLIEGLPDYRIEDKDSVFPMTKEALNLLNWYGEPPKDFAGERGTTEVKRKSDWYGLLLGAVGAVALNANVRPRYCECDKADCPANHLEVTIPADRSFSGNATDVRVSLRESFFERNEKQWPAGLNGDRDNRRIWVKLDTDYDGKIVYQGETVRKSAIAWGVDLSGKNPVVTSW